jgi:hypothetical protein
MRQRLALMLVPALAFALLDLTVKRLVPTDPWLLHPRSNAWLALSVCVLLGAVALVRLPSRAVAIASGILAAGVLGNLVSFVQNDGWVENPLTVSFGGGGIAYNPADVCVLAGIVLQTAALMETAVRYRHLLPQSSTTSRLARHLRARWRSQA